ncbi:MAG: alpha/beta hydrolase [Acidimicrobiales bacterium]
MTSGRAIPQGLHFVADSPVHGLAVAARRVENPLASVICVHGGLDRGGSFARLARRLEHFDLISYDRRGYQGSRGLGPLGLDYDVDDLLHLARREAAGGPVIYFGHSFGGVVALGAALREPAIVRQVIAFEAPLPWIRHRESSRSTLSDDPEHEAEVFFRRMVSNKAWERLSEFEQQSRRLDGPALYNDLSLLRTGATPFDLSRLEVPALYAYGDTYHLEYYRALSVDLRQMSPLIETEELKGVGHGAHLSHPDLLASLIESTWRDRCVLE